MTRFTDRANISGIRKTTDGYIVTEAFAVRTGVQLYTGAEVGMSDRDVVRVYRSEDEVRSPASLQSFSHAPVTMGHPAVNVTADNWKDLAKGEVSTEALWDGNKIKLPLIIKDAETIAAIESGTRELSAGYTCVLDATPGTTPEGEKYDVLQRDIRINHLAVVPKGRAGSECRIGDADHWGASPVPPTAQKDKAMTLRTIMVDGLSVETTDAGAQAIEKLSGQLRDSAANLEQLRASHKTAIDAKDEELGTLKADLASAKAAQLSDADLDKKVAERAQLVADVRTILGDAFVVDGVSAFDLQKAAVAKALGDDAIVGVSDAELRGMYRVVSRDAAKNSDPFARVLKDTKIVNPTVNDADTAYQESLKELGNAWMGSSSKGAN